MIQFSKFIISGILLLSFFFFSGCTQNAASGDAASTEETGNSVPRDMEPGSDPGSETELKFVHHLKNNSRKPKAGEVVYYHYVMRTDQETVRSSHTTGQMSYFQIPDPAKTTAPISPMLQGLMKMSVGDSLTVEQPLPEDAYRPEKHADSNVLYYDLSLRDIKSLEEFQKEIQNKPSKTGGK